MRYLAIRVVASQIAILGGIDFGSYRDNKHPSIYGKYDLIKVDLKKGQFSCFPGDVLMYAFFFFFFLICAFKIHCRHQLNCGHCIIHWI